MRKLKILGLILVVLSVALAAKTWLVRVVRADLRAKPDYLSAPIKQLARGQSVESLGEAEKGWLQVNAGGQKGFLHQSALESRTSVLTGKLAGSKEVSDSEASLAAKGFNESVEAQMRGQKGYNYADLDWLMQRGMDAAKVRKFMEEGKLK